LEKLKVSELNFYFGFTQILKNISFELKENQIISIVGPSGGGKTTLLKLCASLLDVTEGEITNSFSSSAFTFQDARLLPWKTVLENIMLPIVVKVGYKKAYNEACKIALRFGLENKDFTKYPKDLSGGMRQRVNFARALITKPKLLFLDEPFSALDIGLKRELQDFVLQSSKEFGTSVLFITHDLMEAIRLSDEILLLKSDPGEILKAYKIDTPKENRDDSFIFSKTKEFLDDNDVINTFEIKMR
jgi:NitT/TauT family transport system ATP-binding protein